MINLNIFYYYNGNCVATSTNVTYVPNIDTKVHFRAQLGSDNFIAYLVKNIEYYPELQRIHIAMVRL